MFKTPIALAFLSAAALASPVAAQDWAAELYGGGVFDRDEDTAGVSSALDGGTAFGAGLYYNNLLPGAELGFDVMHTDADYTGAATDLKSTSFMLNARLPFEIAPATEAYVGAGLGAIQVDYNGGPGLSGDDVVPGGQIGIGIRHDFSAFTAFGELKHQMSFEDARIQGADQSFEATSAVVGLRFAF